MVPVKTSRDNRVNNCSFRHCSEALGFSLKIICDEMQKKLPG